MRWGQATAVVRGVLIAVLVALALAPAAGAVLVHGPNGRLYGVLPRAGVNPAAIRGSLAHKSKLHAAADFGAVTYQGGPVLHSSDPYLVFWVPGGFTISPTSEQLIERYLADLTAAAANPTNTTGVIRQYYDTTGYADEEGQSFTPASQVRPDSDAYPPLDATRCEPLAGPATRCLTDAQIETELTTFIAVHHLPTGAGAQAPIYFVVTPANVDVCLDQTDCANSPLSTSLPGGPFCAYHSSLPDSGQAVLYAAIPMLAANVGCQSDQYSPEYFESPNRDVADNAIDNLSHENEETITDPLPIDPLNGFQLISWQDPVSRNEVADNCTTTSSTPDPAKGLSPTAYLPTLGGSAIGGPAIGGATTGSGTLYDQLINTDPYYIQTVWSDGELACEAQPVPGAPAFSAGPATPGSLVTFTPSGISSGTWSFGDGSPTEFVFGAQAPTHTYAQVGTYTASVSYVDTDGNLGTLTRQVVIALLPKASFTVSAKSVTAGTPLHFNGSHSSDPNAGGAITAFLWNFGDRFLGFGKATSHAFRSLGHRTVVLTVAGRSGLHATSSFVIDVLADKVTGIRAKRKQLLVTVNGPGTIAIGSRHYKARARGTVKLTPVLSKAQSKQLANAHRLALTVTIKFVPLAGPAQRVSKHVTLRS